MDKWPPEWLEWSKPRDGWFGWVEMGYADYDSYWISYKDYKMNKDKYDGLVIDEVNRLIKVRIRHE